MKQFQFHHLLNVEEAKQYAMANLDIFHNVEVLECEEIGDGNINYIFRVKDSRTGKSIIIKQADKFLRSSGRELDVDHNRIEAEVLQIQRAYAKAYIPEIYLYDSCMHAVFMEDISAFDNLRNTLINGYIVQGLAIEMANFLVSYLMGTSDILLTSEKKKQWLKQFVNPSLCSISEDLVFTEPYNNYKGRNTIQDRLLPFVVENIYHNDDLIFEVCQLRFRFMNLSQSLLHGDLHTGSIFVNSFGKVKIIDPEFAFYGPMGYDIGNVIGNLIFPLVYHHVHVNPSIEFMEWLKQCIQDMYDKVLEELYRVYERDVKLDIYRNERFKEKLIYEIMADSLGYAGTEIIRRSIGDTKVKELQLIVDEELLVYAEKLLLQIGSQLIMNRKKIKNGSSMIQLINNILEEKKDA